MRTAIRIGLLAIGALIAAALVPASASASFHIVKVREVYPGSAANPDSEYIELQMYSPSQNFVAAHTVTAFSATGTSEDYAFSGSVANGDNQDTILIASPEAEAELSVDADLAIVTNVLEPGGGAVCWETLDCVSWGNYSGPALPSPAGAHAPAITDGEALRRSISRGCATLLEGGDDTNNSAADFDLAQPAPRPNSVAPTEKVCAPPATAPDTTITKGPKKKTKSKKATFAFESDRAGATFACKLDRGEYEPCSSPWKYTGLKRGRHVFRVRATAKGKTDATPAEYRWKVKRKRRR
jgi:hypothetical protein